MAILTTATSRTVRLVYTGDPSVRCRPAQPAQPAPATDTKQATDDKLDRRWLPTDEVESYIDATVALVRALSWIEYETVRGLDPVEQVRRVVDLGLVEIDGSTAKRDEFLKSPTAFLVTPLYRAIVDLTWGN